MDGDKFGDCVWDFIHETVNVDICDPREIMFARGIIRNTFS